MIAPALFFTHGGSYMSISAEEKGRYLREAAIVLAREGFHTDRTHTGGLRVLLDGAPLCEGTENGGITYRNEDRLPANPIQAGTEPMHRYDLMSRTGDDRPAFLLSARGRGPPLTRKRPISPIKTFQITGGIFHEEVHQQDHP